MALLCEFCDNVFSTHSNLLLHQKSAKYCLEIRGVSKSRFQCEYCEEKFSRQSSLHRHSDVCPKNNEYWRGLAEKNAAENTALKEKIRELELQLAKKDGMLSVKTAPKTVTRATFNGIVNPKSPERKKLFTRVRTDVKKLAAV